MKQSTDVLIAGAGPAGMAAAVAAARSGCSVIVLDDNLSPGGQIWRGSQPRVRWFTRLARSGAEVISAARIIDGDHSKRTLYVETEDGKYSFAYRKLIITTGARELFLPFPGWTNPNAMGIGGLQALVKSGMSVAGKRIIVAGSGPFLLAAAAYLRKRGAVIPLIAEQAPIAALAGFTRRLLHYPGKILQAAALRLRLGRTRYLPSCWATHAGPAKDGCVVTLRRGEHTWQETCNFLATGYGFQPNIELARALNCRISVRSIEVDRLQQTSVEDIYAAGECTGIGGADLALIEGQIAGFAASGQTRAALSLQKKRRKATQFAEALNRTFKLREDLRQLVHEDTIICRCEDVRWGALRECPSRRAAKLYTRSGMGPCQGRICGPILDFLQTPDRDTARPPVFPARLETLLIDEEIQTR